jgi:hypothetical protein
MGADSRIGMGAVLVGLVLAAILLTAFSQRCWGQTLAEPGRWAFEPAKDAFSADAMFDLRTLNEKSAGASGFVTVSKDGEFLLGNGQPARFWAINTGAYNKNPQSTPDLARHARFLAKHGVNMVRFHGNITPAGGNLTDIDAKERDNLWRLVAAMKKEGIYTTFSPYWAVSSRVTPAMGVPDAGKGKNMGLLFFDPKLQDAYKAWMKQVLAEKNPYTGVPLAEDPALAIIQLQNEDSLLFWTSQSIEKDAAAELRQQFGKFLAKKYGALDKAKEAWGGPAAVKEDNFAAGEAGLYIIWNLTQDLGDAAQKKRTADQTQFMVETMYNFNKMMGDYLRKDLGCKQLVNAGNWRTADQVRLLDGERYSYCANEVMGVNRYVDGIHEGKNNGWAIDKGDKFTDDSVLLNPRQLPVSLKQVDGRPMIIPESSWVPPLGYQSEGPFLVAAYGGLSGVGPYYWFATGVEDWYQPASANGYMASQGKWVCASPMLLGQFPAAALMYRMGYVKKGAPAVVEQRSLTDLWQRKQPIIAEDPGFDPNRDKGKIAPESNIKDGVDPLAFLVGPVVARYDADPSKSKVIDLAPFIDKAKKTVKSVTGELEFDYGRGVCTVNAAKAQGACGFLKPVGAVKLHDVEIVSGNDYAAILVVAMDDKPLAQSGKILVQVGTTERSTGWKTKPADITVDKTNTRKGEEVVDFGKAPWQIVEGDVTIKLKNAAVKTACVLDANGLSVKQIPLKDADGTKEFKFPPDALYVVLK